MLFRSGLAMMVGMAILLGLAGKWLYWSDVNRKIAQATVLFPNDSQKALEWLKKRGGVNVGVPIVVVIILFSLEILASMGRAWAGL